MLGCVCPTTIDKMLHSIQGGPMEEEPDGSSQTPVRRIATYHARLKTKPANNATALRGKGYEIPDDYCVIAFTVCQEFGHWNQSSSGARPRGTGFVGCSLASLNSFPAFTDHEREHKKCSHRVRPPPPKPHIQAHPEKEG